MSLPSSGSISFSDIQTLFGGSNPISINEYFKDGAYINSNKIRNSTVQNENPIYSISSTTPGFQFTTDMISSDSGYKYIAFHNYTTTNIINYDLTFNEDTICDVLIVGGGGSGGVCDSGAGGAGGVLCIKNINVKTAEIKVGKGGDSINTTTSTLGNNGYNSTFKYTNTSSTVTDDIYMEIPPNNQLDITVENGVYVLNNILNNYYTYIGFDIGTYYLNNIPVEHPLGFVINDTSKFEVTSGTIFNQNEKTIDGVSMIYYTGNIIIEVKEDFGIISYSCYYHGYMGGYNKIKFINTTAGSGSGSSSNSQPVWQYFKNTYISSGEYTSRNTTTVTPDDVENNPTRLAQELQYSINNGYFGFLWGNPGSSHGVPNGQVEFNYVGSGKKGTITLTYNRYGSMTNYNGHKRHMYVHIANATAAGVYQEKSYATLLNADGTVWVENTNTNTNTITATSFSPGVEYIADGGGGGGKWNTKGNDGGSGGGGGGNNATGGSSTQYSNGYGLGNNGGTGSNTYSGGGGGGASESGENGGPGDIGGNGGKGINYSNMFGNHFGEYGWFGGGGGAGSYTPNENGNGGKGGGGSGGINFGDNGLDDSGGGGGSARTSGPSGKGGSGIVIIRFKPYVEYYYRQKRDSTNVYLFENLNTNSLYNNVVDIDFYNGKSDNGTLQSAKGLLLYPGSYRVSYYKGYQPTNGSDQATLYKCIPNGTGGWIMNHNCIPLTRGIGAQGNWHNQWRAAYTVPDISYFNFVLNETSAVMLHSTGTTAWINEFGPYNNDVELYIWDTYFKQQDNNIGFPGNDATWAYYAWQGGSSHDIKIIKYGENKSTISLTNFHGLTLATGPPDPVASSIPGPSGGLGNTGYEIITGLYANNTTRSEGTTSFDNRGATGRGSSNNVSYPNLIIQAKPGDVINLIGRINTSANYREYCEFWVWLGGSWSRFSSPVASFSGNRDFNVNYTIPTGTSAGNYAFAVACSYYTLGASSYRSWKSYSLHVWV